MSGFYGVFSPVQPINALAFQQMSAHAGSDGFDAHETHQSTHLGMGHLMLRTSPEAVFDKQPLVSACGRYTLTGHFRLDYRDELGDKLGICFEALKMVPDSMLVMMAFEKWQEDCVHHLEGDWAFVLYDSKENRLFLVKDQSGISALFHIRVGDQVYFASTTTTILAVKEHRFEIHHENLIRYTRPGHYPEGGETLIRELYYVNNGEFLFYTAGLEKAVHTYWSLDDSKMIRYTHEEDYVHGLFSVYSAAVRSRLRSDQEIGIFLSGGLDSSSVAALAASELKRQGRVLNSYTSFPHFEALLPKNEKIMANEVPLVKELVKYYENIQPHYLDFPDLNLKGQFTSDQVREAYHPIISKNSFWVNGILSLSRDFGIRRIMTGQLGNDTITWTSPYVYAGMIYQLRFIDVYYAIKKDLLISSLHFFPFMLIFVLGPLKAKFFSVFNSNGRRRKEFILPYLSGSSCHQKTKLIRIFLNIKNGLGALLQGENKERRNRLKEITSFAGIKWALEAQRNHVEVADPTSDNRLITLSLSIPETMFFRPGRKKYIFTLMMNGIVPDAILCNRLLKLQSLDYPMRLKADQQFSVFLKNQIPSTGFITSVDLESIRQLFITILQNPENYIQDSGIKVFLNSYSLFCFDKIFD